MYNIINDSFGPPRTINIYFNVPFSKKNIAKDLRMLWCSSNKLWYKKIDLCSIYSDSEILEKELIEILPERILEFDFVSLCYNKTYYEKEQLEYRFKQLYNKKQKELEYDILCDY